MTAALEQFLADTAPVPTTDGPWINPWQRAALYEGVRAKDAVSLAMERSRPHVDPSLIEQA